MNQRILSGRDVHRLLWPKIAGLDREQYWRLDLDARRRLRGAELVASGGLDHAVADPRIIFKGALQAGAASIVLAHNHPSGDPTPSRADILVAQRMDTCGLLLGIRVVDHVIIAQRDFFSFAENHPPGRTSKQ